MNKPISEHRRAYKKQWNRLNAKKVNSWNRRYYRKNRTLRLKEIASYHRLHKKERREYSRKYHLIYYPKNRDRLIRQTSIYAKTHPEVRRRCNKNWVRNHPEKSKANHVKKEARRRGAKIGDRNVSKEIERLRRQPMFTCYYCKGVFNSSQLNIDHVIAIAKGGKHASSNICASCGNCNRRKNDRPASSLELPQPVLNL